MWLVGSGVSSSCGGVVEVLERQIANLIGISTERLRPTIQLLPKLVGITEATRLGGPGEFGTEGFGPGDSGSGDSAPEARLHS